MIPGQLDLLTYAEDILRPCPECGHYEKQHYRLRRQDGLACRVFTCQCMRGATKPQRRRAAA